MKILVDARHLIHPNPSGVGVYSIELMRALKTHHPNMHLHTLSTGRQAGTNLPLPGIPHTHVPVSNKLLHLRTLTQSSQQLADFVSNKPDLLFYPNISITSVPTKIPSVLTVHDMSWQLMKNRYGWKQRLWHECISSTPLLQKVTAIITPSQSTKDDLLNQIDRDPESVHVIPHGVSSLFSKRMEPQDHGIRSQHHLPPRFALYLGTLEPRKNLPAILEGMRLYRAQTGDDLPLILAGLWGWKSRAIKKQLWRSDTRTWVRTLGYIPAEDRAALYRAASVVLWPSLYEGFGLPVLEALACGTPIITSYTSSVPEVAGDAAIMVNPLNPNELAHGLSCLMQDPALSSTLVAKGVHRASTFTWKRCAQKTAVIFEETIKKTSR